MGTMGNLSMGHMGKMAMGGKKGGKITSYTHSPAVTVRPLICFFHYSQREKSMEREDWEIGEGNRTGTGPDRERKGDGIGLSLGLTCSLTRLVWGKGIWQTRQVDLGLFSFSFCSSALGVFCIRSFSSVLIDISF